MANEKKDRKPKASPTWSDVKARLSDFDRNGLIGLIADLYALNQANKDFLHARFAVGADPLEAYKKRIEKAVFPNIFRNEPVKVVKAKEAISEYRKAIGLPEGELELRVYFCEVAIAFAMDYAYADEGFLGAVLRQFETSLKILQTLVTGQESMLSRLKKVQNIAQNIGYGIADEMGTLLKRHEVRVSAG